MTGINNTLETNPANYQPQTPLSFLLWAVSVYPEKIAVIDGDQQYTYQQFYERCLRLSSALKNAGVGDGDIVAVMAPNSAPMLESHYGVAMAGAVLNALNFRLDAKTIAFILNHAKAKVLLTDREFSHVIKNVLSLVDHDVLVIDIDTQWVSSGKLIGDMDYEAFLKTASSDLDNWSMPTDEWQSISLNYTSGTTGNPKGVMYHHRGAFLNAMGNAMVMGLNRDTVYLWTLPMFHCNGWTFTWAVTAVGGTHVCVRSPDPALVFPMIDVHGVTHMCAAPIVLNMLIHAPNDMKTDFPQTVDVATGGAAPPSAVISAMEKMGFRVMHLYGLTETYGPAVFCAWQDEWNVLNDDDKALKMARQGVRYPTLFDQAVLDPDTMKAVPSDGKTIGELMVRGNTVMKGYYKNQAATEDAFKGGWFHTGDLGVVHTDGYVEIKDRSKDIIISGGENISSLEIEEVLYRHASVLEAAVVAKPDDKWGETPCAFVTLKNDGAVCAKDIINWCRDHMAHFKVPGYVVFGDLPKTSTGKIQKFTLREQAKRVTADD